MFNLNQLNHFRLVTETGNFASAARRAHITQPALSNSIRTLEEHIGVQLFDRSERPIRVTPAGRDLLVRVDVLLAEAKNLKKEIGYLVQGLAGELRIGMTAHSAASIGGAILGKWLTENGRVRADVSVASTSVLLDLLRKEKLDLIIGDGRDLPTRSSEFEMASIPPQQGRVFCRAGHPVLDLPKLSFQDLLPYRFAGAHFPTIMIDHLADLFGLRSRDDIELAIESDNIAIVRDAVIHSDLMLLTLPSCVSNELAAKLIVELPIELGTPANWQTVTLKNAIAHPAIASLKTAIIQVTQQG
ncbi:LysR family transcriptional regulator [Aequoribacter sp.]|uniref:LysR family transcriptional regulator n=1 Tax=Aequoribacter sp. TaxID=2847771 RepID=UPI003F698AB5